MSANAKHVLASLAIFLSAFSYAPICVNADVDFENDIIPIFTKSGCNAGACHGAAIGRGGFKLSLYGGNPNADYDAIVHQLRGRRINLAKPAESLLLLKPTEHLSHEGGTLFDIDSESALLLLKWIQTGASSHQTRKLLRVELTPQRVLLEDLTKSAPLHAKAVYSDGTTRDVTSWTVFTPEDATALTIDTDSYRLSAHRRGRHIATARFLTEVLPIEVLVPLSNTQVDIDNLPKHNYIDEHVNSTLNTLHIPASHQSSDSEYIRRLFLDLTGRLPRSANVRSFHESGADNKRHLLVKELLASEEFTDYWAYLFANYLRIRPQRLGGEGAQAYFDWVRTRLADNASYKDIASELLLSSGDTSINGVANFYRTTTSARLQTEFVSELFMGTRLRCANCHNHPLDRWTQDDYHGLAAIFSKLDISENVRYKPDGTTIHPGTLEPAKLRIPGETRLLDQNTDPRGELASWLTRDDNPYFAKAIVNRIWKQLMGRGLVEPVDDFRSTNPPTHPALLNALADDFRQHNYDIRHTIEVITQSAAYQRSSNANAKNQYDDLFYSHTLRVQLDPAVHADAVSDILGISERYGELPLGTRAINILNPTTVSRTLDILGRCGREDSCETTSQSPDGLTQKLHFFNGPFINARINVSGSRLDDLLSTGTKPIDIITEYYLAAFSRFPKPAETEFWHSQLNQLKGQEEVTPFLEDFVWGILTSNEFVTNH